MKLFKYWIAPLGLLISINSIVFGQEGELPEEQIIIQKDKKIVLPEISKPFEKVTTSLKPLPKQKQKYSYKELPITLTQLDPKLNPPMIRPERELEVKNGYARFGLGNYGSTLLDAFYNSGRQKDYAYGLFLKHLASARGPVSNSGFSQNELGAYTKYFTPTFTLTGGLNYQRNRYNFYGYDREAFPKRDLDSTKQLFQRVGFQLQLEGAKKNKKLQHHGDFGISNISDRFKASETLVELDWAGNYRLKDSSRIHFLTDFVLAKRTDSATQNRSLFRIQPSYEFKYKGFMVEAGFQVAFVSEPTLNAQNRIDKAESKAHFHPRIRLQQEIFGQKLFAFAGLSGGMNKKTLASHIEANPFLAPNVYLRHENQKLALFAGVQGFVNQVAYRSSITFENLENQAFYINSPEGQEKFLIVYDSSTTRRFSWENELNVSLSEKTQAGIRMGLFSYGVKSVKKPWHLPSFTSSVFGRHFIHEQVALSSELYVLSGMRALDPKSGEAVNLKALVDLNAKGEYFFKKDFTGFISIHNLLNNKNQRYYQYPVQGLRVMVGASARF